MVLDKQKLLKDGFLSFNLKDINESLYNELYKNFKKDSFLNDSNKELMFRYDGNIELDNLKIKVDINEYFHKILSKFNLKSNSKIDTTPIDLNHYNKGIKLSFVLEGEYKSLIRFEKILNKFKYHTSQSWYFSGIKNNQDTLKKSISDIYVEVITNLYSDSIVNLINYNPDNIIHGTDVSIYHKGNYIEDHEDGYVEGRMCVILIYLNDDYKEGYGGELVINESSIIKPEFGNITILDFTKHNIHHSVSPILDDNFKRFAFIKFFYQ